MKKRKLFGGTVDELNLPASKHKCCEGADDKDLLDMTEKSAQDSNCFPEDSQSSAGLKFDASFRKADYYDDASASWSYAESGISRLDSIISSGVMDEDEEIISSNGGHYQCQDLGLPDIDCLEGCFSAENAKDKQKTSEGLEEFLSSTGVNQNLFVQSSERWILDQEAQLERHRPTIDQEFEQYFSMLML